MGVRTTDQFGGRGGRAPRHDALPSPKHLRHGRCCRVHSCDMPGRQTEESGASTSTGGAWVDSSGRRNTSIVEVLVGRPAGWMTELTGRSPMRSPGAPRHRREIERAFWLEIATGKVAEDAARAVGVAPAVGCRWYRHAGGMTPFKAGPLSGRYLSFSEREEIALLKARGAGVREIARQLGRDPSTISRELRRNAATRGGKLDYRASVAHWKAELVARRPKTAKLVTNPRLHAYVQERLSGQIRRPDGTVVTGPSTGPWTGRNKPHRGDRAWVQGWSPEQIYLHGLISRARMVVDNSETHGAYAVREVALELGGAMIVRGGQVQAEDPEKASRWRSAGYMLVAGVFGRAGERGFDAALEAGEHVARGVFGG